MKPDILYSSRRKSLSQLFGSLFLAGLLCGGCHNRPISDRTSFATQSFASSSTSVHEQADQEQGQSEHTSLKSLSSQISDADVSDPSNPYKAEISSPAANSSSGQAAVSSPGAIVPTVQENEYYCGPAVLQSLLAYHGIDSTQKQLAQALNTNPQTGTEYEDLARVASEMIFGKQPADDLDPGYRSSVFKNTGFHPADAELFLSRANIDLRNGDPVIAGLNPAVLNPETGFDSVHVVLIYGMSLAADSSDIVSFEVMDPSYVWQEDHPACFTVSRDNLLAAMAACKEPGYVW